MRTGRSASRGGQQGVVLLEALAAVLVFSVGILALIGIQALSVTSMSDARDRLEAVAVANREIGNLWADSALPVPATRSVPELPNGTLDRAVTAAVGGAMVTITVTWQPPNASSPHTHTTYANIFRE